jgi:3''5''-cyclic nucleotide phosphodiesterase.
MRKSIIHMILATDMSKHFEIIGKFRHKIMNFQNLDDKNAIFAMGIKCADVGHSAKPTEVHEM